MSASISSGNENTDSSALLHKLKNCSQLFSGFNFISWSDESSSYPSATIGNAMNCSEFNSGMIYFTKYQFQPFAQQSQEQYGKGNVHLKIQSWKKKGGNTSFLETMHGIIILARAVSFSGWRMQLTGWGLVMFQNIMYKQFGATL